MLFRKVSVEIEEYLKSDNDKILVIEGARQIGKSYIIRDDGLMSVVVASAFLSCVTNDRQKDI